MDYTKIDGNAFGIIGAVSRHLKNEGRYDEAEAFTAKAMESESYDKLLQFAMATVPHTVDNEDWE